MIRLFLTPLDVWLFRDGKPFDAHSDHHAQSLFPPYPTVMQGVIRSHQLVRQGVDLWDRDAIRQAVGDAENYGNLRLRGPFVAQCKENPILYFPQPANAHTVDEKQHTFKPASPPMMTSPTVITNSPTPYLLGLNDESQKPETGLWVSLQDLRNYLQGATVTGIPAHCLFEREARVGIARNDTTHTTEEGMLYEVDFIRPQPGIGLYVEMEGYEGWSSGALRIGGEGHGAQFEPVTAVEWPVIPNPLPALFKIYFTTPTYFTKGWQPESWDKFFDGGIELVAAAVGRYESLGGFDWASGRHKPARRYVPAGSVYYFKSQGTASLKPGLTQNAITDLGAEIGFGQIIITEWKENGHV
ncbi:MAG: type III-B CRISPR module-associated protein Cmr3 [Anaerolineae bacterium]|nr:type III-B CRISPR module-associated protein Cmr3 [Anaerolineae bacterium]